MSEETKNFLSTLVDLVHATYVRAGLLSPNPKDVADKALDMYNGIMIDTVREAMTKQKTESHDWSRWELPKQ
jgi:hypothetical protein